ncbi:hypothetical protein BD311DRAFT_666742 [Dichomitus squalens]|uniref:Mid2 domain-containing protein n=1 Tax=Dichomitus squalens TaxID=114155 RepID=A0A4Q9MHH6_9APHY|nr:hypothetical protein BD311DRAFT_666742 [Dichomitus squalens]
MRHLLSQSFVYILFTALRTSLALNRTIDDQLGDVKTGLQPLYRPEGAWSQGADCTFCLAVEGRVDVSRAMNGTWHSATYDPTGADASPPSVQANFTGHAVYVYALLANIIPAATTHTSLSFYIDGQYSGQFVHIPSAVPYPQVIEYDVLVYSNNKLSNVEHSITIEASGTDSSLVLFDYIMYTDNSTASDVALMIANPSTSSPMMSSQSATSSSRNKSPIVIGVVVGVIVGIASALITLAIAFLVIRRRRSDLLPRSWKSKRFVLPAVNDRPPSLPSSMRHASTESLISVSLPTPRTASPIVSSLNQSTEATHTRDYGEITSTSPDPPVPRNGRGRGPPRHRVDVPGPALSTTGTEHSTRLADLIQQILSVEEEIRTHQNAKHNDAPKYRRPDGSTSVADLRGRIRQLRAEVQRERLLLSEALPVAKRL